jgi:hypothetical protein
MHDACTHNTPAPTFIFFSPSFLPPSQFPLVTNEIEVSVRNPSAINDGTLSFHQQSNTSVLAWGSLGGDGWVRADHPLVLAACDLRHPFVAVTPPPTYVVIRQGGLNPLFKTGGEFANSQGFSQIRSVLRSVGSEMGCEEDVVALSWLYSHPSGIVPSEPDVQCGRVLCFVLFENLPLPSNGPWLFTSKILLFCLQSSGP